MQFFIQYNLGIDGANWKASTKGTIIHKVMEVIAGLKKYEQDKPKARTLILDDDNLGKLKIGKSAFRTEEYVDQLIDDCYNFYTEKCENSYDNKDYKFCIKWAKEALTFNGGEFDPRNQNILQPEQFFDITFDEDWAKYNYNMPDGRELSGNLSIKGTIDLLTLEDENTIETIDYKTGQRKNFATGKKKTQEYLEKDPQLLLYYYAIKKLYPEYDNVIMTIYFVRDGGPFSMCFDEIDEEYFIQKIKDRFDEVVSDKTPSCIKYHPAKKSNCFMCRYGRENWPGTNTRICDFVETNLEYLGMDETIRTCAEDGFDIGYYHAPGS
jgi:hypothetical protein